MSVLTRLALFFVGVPLLELLILVQLGQVVGLWPTLGLVILTGFVGASLARMEGLKTLWRLQSELAQGRLPGDALLDGFAILVGGALLLTPGILTDLLGFSFLLPPTRRLILGRVRRSLEERLRSGTIHVTHVVGFPGGGSFAWGSGHLEGNPMHGPADAGRGGGDGEGFLDPSREIIVEPREPRGR